MSTWLTAEVGALVGVASLGVPLEAVDVTWLEGIEVPENIWQAVKKMIKHRLQRIFFIFPHWKFDR